MPQVTITVSRERIGMCLAFVEVGSSTSARIDDGELDEVTEATLDAVMQGTSDPSPPQAACERCFHVLLDLRCIYRDLANEENSIEITDDFSDLLIDRLEFSDQLIRTVLDDLLRKHIVQAAKDQSNERCHPQLESVAYRCSSVNNAGVDRVS